MHFSSLSEGNMANDKGKESAEFLAKAAGNNQLITRYAWCNN